MKKGLIWGSIIGSLFLLTYGIGVNVFSTRFVPNTQYAGIEIGGLTVEEALKTVNEGVEYPQLIIKEQGNDLGVIHYKDLLTVDFTDSLTELKDEQNPFNWVINSLQSTNQDTDLLKEGSFNGLVLEKELTTLINKTDRVPSEDAYIAYTEELGYHVYNSKQGTEVNQEQVIKAIQDERPLVISVDKYYKQPKLTGSSTEIQEEYKAINAILDTEITYDFTDSKHTIPKSLIEEWLIYDGNQSFSLDYDKVTSYLWTLNDTYATRNKERQFQSTKKGIVTIQPQIYGWEFDVDAEFYQLQEDLLAGESLTREPHIVGRVKTNTLGRDDIGSNYVEIDIAAQHLYLYKDGKLVLETPVVTGMPPIMDTIPGAWHILYKETDATLRGYNPHYDREYATPVDYWVPFDYGGMGVHDANWQSRFGGSVYQTSGSNGCINMPPNIMPTFFSLVEEGLPVIIY